MADNPSIINIPIKNMVGEEQPAQSQPQEPSIQFKRFTDKMTLSVDTKDGEKVAQISGYGIQVGFNYKYFKTQEDLETAANSIAALVVKLAMDAMIQQVNAKVDKQSQ